MAEPRLCLVYPDQDPLPRAFRKVTNIPASPMLLPPLGLLSLAANYPEPVRIIDNRLDRVADAVLADMLAGYAAVGFGGTIFEAAQAMRVSALLRARGVKTLYGGPNATVNWKLYAGAFDAIFRGEAERDLPEFIARLTAGTLPEWRELEIREEQGTLVNHATRRIADLDALKPPDRGAVLLARYNRREDRFLPGVAPVDTVASSRGCPFDCAFCSSCSFWGRAYTCRSAADVLKEIAALRRDQGTRGIYFREDNFTAVRERVLEFAAGMARLEMPWLCESRVDTLDAELLRAMRDGGCRGIWFGIETVSESTMRAIGKPVDLARVRAVTAQCRELGMRTGGGFMVGFPDEDAAAIAETFAVSRKLGLDHAFYNRLWLIPGTRLYDEVRAAGLATYEYQHIVLPATKYLTSEQVTDAYYTNLYNRRTRLLRAVVPQGLVDYLRDNARPLYALARRLVD